MQNFEVEGGHMRHPWVNGQEGRGTTCPGVGSRGELRRIVGKVSREELSLE
jgi:hypothetical protein